METRLVYLTNQPFSVAVSALWTGTYNPSTAYTAGQGVYYNNNGYVATRAVPVNTPPAAGSSYWAKAVDSQFTAGSPSAPVPQATASNPNSGVAVGTSSTRVVDPNSNRVQVWVYNNDPVNVAYLSYGGTAALNTGIRLNPNGGSHTTQLYKGAINAVAAGALTLTVVEV